MAFTLGSCGLTLNTLHTVSGFFWPQAKLLGFGGDAHVSQSPRDGLLLFQVHLPGFVMDNNVVKVGGSVGLVGAQNTVHHPLKGSWSSMDTEREYGVLTQTFRGYEIRLLLGLGIEGYLPIPFGKGVTCAIVLVSLHDIIGLVCAAPVEGTL